MSELTVLGVTHVSDFYPNVKYKLALLEAQGHVRVQTLVRDLGAGGLYRDLRSSHRVLQLLRIAAGTLEVWLRFLWRRSPRVYVLYPGPVLVLLLGLLPPRWRPRIFLDAFISLYDTVVYDRKLLAAASWRARLLWWMERRAFALAETVLVDTPQNGRHYAVLFRLPADRFVSVPLAIPPLPACVPRADPGKVFTCLFIGSLVPLHGIERILEAAQRLDDMPDLRFVVIGDGQDGWKIEEFLRGHGTDKLVWQRGMYPTAHIAAAICDAHLCLGIFGDGAKAQRVLPYKLYCYAALGKPFLTLATPCLEELCGEDAALLLSGASGNNNDLAALIRACILDVARLRATAAAADRLHRKHLHPEIMERRLLQILFDQA